MMSPGHALIAASVVLCMTANGMIWAGTWRQRDRPVVMSWAVWAALMAIGGAAAWRAGQAPAAVYGGCCALGCLGVAVLALRIPAAERAAPVRVLGRLSADGRGARLDLLLLPAALAGLMLLCTPLFPAGRVYMSTQSPTVAVTVGTDLVAFAPTFAHCWTAPGEEPPAVYGLFGLGAACSLAAVALHGDMLVLAAVAYPLYLTAADGAAAALITARRMRPGWDWDDPVVLQAGPPSVMVVPPTTPMMVIHVDPERRPGPRPRALPPERMALSPDLVVADMDRARQEVRRCDDPGCRICRPG